MTFYMCSISHVNTPMFKHVTSVMLTWRFCSISCQSVQVWLPCSQIFILKIIPIIQRNSSHFQLLSEWFIITFKICTSKVVAQWLRCCATSRKVSGSIPDGVIEIFLWHNLSDHTMALGSTQPLTEMSTRWISWGKCGRYVRLTTLPPPCAVVMKSGNLNFLEHSGPLQACNGTDILFYIYWLLL